MDTLFIENAKITNTFLGREDHNIMTFYITVEFSGGGCSYGGYSLDEYDKSTRKRVCSQIAMQSIVEVIDTIGVNSWEELKGQYIRIEHEGLGGGVVRIGNLMKNKWFSLKEFFEVHS
jgi:hypothetical protein